MPAQFTYLSFELLYRLSAGIEILSRYIVDMQKHLRKISSVWLIHVLSNLETTGASNCQKKYILFFADFLLMVS